ncbi:LOG family protein [Candidatus Peregrinibacteria bacterium]|jgi:uncharacterized protein (TIGR00730 family)|nr:LOG family protein [Candidatus Peregrinibacteria bacterium]MBT4631963.1 LOG family protein [Candidatus Peregrinibacteria bacterium]MBT5516967.1 LOG family protein [Candidatus Peregrinibacteria bacterium]MBT5823648.1 LOG family protein [Candidatus Peregrinibacteria bacterium]
MSPQPFNLKKELKKNDFRVAIFGSARIKEDDPVYKEAYRLAHDLAGDNIDLITGGGPGIMQAASSGHSDGDENGTSDNIGLNIALPFEQVPNETLDLITTHERFSTRLDEFMMLSNVVVVMPGGIGTCLEFFYTWQLIQVNHICKMPIILVGKMWRELINWVIDEPLKYGYLSSEDLDSVVCVEHAGQAMEVIQKAKAEFKKNPDACINWRKYGDDLQGKVT